MTKLQAEKIRIERNIKWIIKNLENTIENINKESPNLAYLEEDTKWYIERVTTLSVKLSNLIDLEKENRKWQDYKR